MPNDEIWLIPKLNQIYDNALNTNNVKHHSGFGIDCDYALARSSSIPEKNVKKAIGFGIAFPKTKGGDSNRIIILKDIIDIQYIE